jgi:hypothetical protein
MYPYGATRSKISLIAIAGFAGIWLAVVPGVVHAADKQAEEFRKEGARARESIEKARDQLKKTVEAYDVLLGSEAKKLEKHHDKLRSEIKEMGKVVEEVRKRVESFQKTAEEFFASWGTLIEGIGTESIKVASGKRLLAARALFKNMSDNLDAAGEEYRPLVASLKEQATLIGQDLSTETLAILGKEAAPDIHARAEKVYASLEQSLSKEVKDEAEMDTILEEEETETQDE